MGQAYAVFSMLQLRFWRKRAASLPLAGSLPPSWTPSEEVKELVNAAAKQYGGGERTLPDGMVAAPLLDGKLLQEQSDTFVAP